MMSARCWLLLGLLGAAGAAKERVSPVEKVLELLGELKTKVSSEVAAESKAMEEYMEFCNENMRERGYAIKTAVRAINDLQSRIEDEKATIVQADEDIQELGLELAAKQRDLQNATKTRKFEKIDFEFAEKKLLKEIHEAEQAIEEIKQQSLLQRNGKGPKMPTEGLRGALRAVQAGAAIVGGADKSRLKSLLQSAAAASAEEGDELSFKNAVKQPAVDDLVEVVESTKAKAEGELESLRKKDLEDAHGFALLEAGLNDELKNMQGKLATATAMKQQATESLAGAEGDLSEAKTGKADDEKFSRKMKMDCSTKSQEWEDRFKSAQGELGAIATATKILSEGVTAALVQSSSQSGLKDDRRLRIAQILRGLGKEYHNFALVQLSTAAALDPFAKLRGLMEDMIAKLMQAAQSEATHKQFCDSEIDKSKASMSEKQGKVAKLSARMEEASASIAELQGATATLLAEIAEIDKAQKEATALRTEAKAQNAKAMQTYKESADAVVAAIGALKSYYESAALVQTRRQSSHQPALGSSQNDAAGAIIGVLEQAESDFSQMLAETEADEAAAAKAYEDETQANTVSRAEKEAAVSSKKSQVKNLQVSLSHSEEDHASVAEELSAVTTYMDKLTPECETKVMSYSEEKAARDAEIEGLKEALNILVG